MRKLIFLLSFLFVYACSDPVFAQSYGEFMAFDSTFSSTDSTILTHAAGLDSIPGTGKTGGIRTQYTALQYIGRAEGKYGLFFWQDSVGPVGGTPYSQLYVRHYYGRDKNDLNIWGGWMKLSQKKESEWPTSSTVYDSLTYDTKYFTQFEYSTFLPQFHQSKGVQFKIITLDTLGVTPYLSHFPR